MRAIFFFFLNRNNNYSNGFSTITKNYPYMRYKWDVFFSLVFKWAFTKNRVNISNAPLVGKYCKIIQFLLHFEKMVVHCEMLYKNRRIGIFLYDFKFTSFTKIKHFKIFFKKCPLFRIWLSFVKRSHHI